MEAVVNAADRLALEIAGQNDGRIEIELYREGREDAAAQALVEHCSAMVREGYLRRGVVSGTKARMQGARQVVSFQWTEAGAAVHALLGLGKRA